MSNQDVDCKLSSSAVCADSAPGVQRITARSAEIGGNLPVNRVLPTRQRRLIGAWCFLDHAGPAHFAAGEGMHVGAHPHTCLQTFTWMIEGEVLHRDSLGNEQIIRPGEVNLMTAGRGITHTEDSLASTDRLHAAQLWIALPQALGDCAPAFAHYPELPRWQAQGVEHSLLVGVYAGQESPVEVHSPLLAMDLASTAGGALQLDLNAQFEHGILLLEGELSIGTEVFSENQLGYIGRGHENLKLQMSPGCRAILLGGEPFADEILMFWNFVGYSKPQIAQAWRDWQAGDPRFGRVPGHDGQPLAAPALPWRV
ncbi:pirin family protein [Halopseudomonas sabulinigri]|uniref:Pirin family protein n=1 Tax=Halopseudomonas sabulinigri TaxID=472181 RepID=A0ABP9ZS13_9GAMM